MTKRKANRFWRYLLFFSLLGILIVNVVMYNHAYQFLHFEENPLKLPKSKGHPNSLTEKIKFGFFGQSLRKSPSINRPSQSYTPIAFSSDLTLQGWWIPSTQSSDEITILCHGYTSNKSNMLHLVDFFHRLGQDCLVFDFRACGDTEGNQSSIGFFEAKDVKAAYEYAHRHYPNKKINIFGTSMGAVATMKAIHDYRLSINKLILQCPYQNLEQAVINRFENQHLPTTILPQILLFWGGIQLGIDSKELNTLRYTQAINMPTLVIHGLKDTKVRTVEIEQIFNSIQGPKQLLQLPCAAHNYPLKDCPKLWTKEVSKFMRLGIYE